MTDNGASVVLEADAAVLDAYSQAVMAVAERLLPSVASLDSDERNWLAWLLEYIPTVDVWVQRWTNEIRFGAEADERRVPK